VGCVHAPLVRAIAIAIKLRGCSLLVHSLMKTHIAPSRESSSSVVGSSRLLGCTFVRGVFDRSCLLSCFPSRFGRFCVCSGSGVRAEAIGQRLGTFVVARVKGRVLIIRDCTAMVQQE